MTPELQRRIQRYGWDRAENSYERFWARQLAPAQERTLELAQLAPAEQVLDVACGTGLVTLPAARAVGLAGRVVATDISEAMVRRTAAAAAMAGLAQVETLRADAEDLRHAGDGFDAALCALGLMYVPDPVAALRQMRAALRTGGRAVAAVWGARAACGWAEIFPIVDRRVRSEVCPHFFGLGTGDALGLAFREAGFGEVEIERMRVTLRYDSATDAIGAAFAGGPVALAYSRFDAGSRDAAHAEYLASIAPYRRGERYAIPGEFVIARARR